MNFIEWRAEDIRMRLVFVPILITSMNLNSALALAGIALSGSHEQHEVPSV
jgi:hypothetical protein